MEKFAQDSLSPSTHSVRSRASGNPEPKRPNMQPLGPRFRARACTHLRNAGVALSAGQAAATLEQSERWGRSRERSEPGWGAFLAYASPRRLFHRCTVRPPTPNPSPPLALLAGEGERNTARASSGKMCACASACAGTNGESFCLRLLRRGLVVVLVAVFAREDFLGDQTGVLADRRLDLGGDLGIAP